MQDWIWAPICFAVLLVGLSSQRFLNLFPEDVPGTSARKQHQQPTPLVGWSLGLAAVFLAFGHWWLMTGLAIATYVGYQDDRSKGHRQPDYPWHRKGLFLVAAASCAAWHLRQLHPGLAAGDVALALLLLFVITNAANFLDNSNGVSAGLGGLGLLWASGGDGAMARVGYLFLGFVPLNWPVARAFLGDSAALPLGLCLGAAALDTGIVRQQGVGLAALLPMSVFLIDFAQVVTCRLVIGVAPWIGDRRHITHILQNLGLPSWLLAPILCGVGFAIFTYGQQLIAQ